MKSTTAALFFIVALPVLAIAAPTSITCNGSFLDPTTGRAIQTGKSIVFAFDFDSQTQTMTLTEGAAKPTPLRSVSVSDGIATGTDGKNIYEVNRIDGTATLRTDLDNDPESKRLGIVGNYYKGNCTVRGVAKF